MLLADDEDQLGQRQEKGVGFITEHATKEKEQEMGQQRNDEGKIQSSSFRVISFSSPRLPNWEPHRTQ